MIAPPRDMPDLTKPNTLPICPGGEASFNITSRGVRLAPSASPEANIRAITATPDTGSQPTESVSAAETIVSTTANPSTRCL